MEARWWSRLVSGFRDRFTRPGIDPSGAAVFTTTYGMGGNESILPLLQTGSVRAYKSNAVVFGTMLKRMSLFSEATLVFRDLEDKSLSGSFESDGRRNTALRILERPWPNGTTGDLLARMMQDNDLAGNAYVWHTGSQLVRLRPDWVTIVSEFQYDALGRQYRVPVGYFYDPPPTANEGPPILLSVDEVAHWAPNPDPEANFRGMSWITPVIREIWADQAMTEYKIKYLENAASPNLLVKYAQKIGQPTVQRIQERITDRHGGVDNAFRTLVLDEGADAMIIGNSFEQMNFSTVQAAGENRIIIASGVPGIVVGTKEGLLAATYSNYDQAMRAFADLTIRPLWRSVCDCLSALINVPAGTRLWFDASDIAALRQGEKEQADTTLVLAQACAALVKEGYEPKSVALAVTSGDLTLLKFVNRTPDPVLNPNMIFANPELSPSANAPAAKPTQSELPVLNGAKKPVGASA